MNKRIKIGLIGICVTTIIAILLYLVEVSPVFVAPFLLPWMALVLIGFTDKKPKIE
ncbi:MAG: hypothetical protein JNL69_05440 [Bacteroidia bacterium]|nr:hypothetical protein [Bacteroidia bacterium]